MNIQQKKEYKSTTSNTPCGRWYWVTWYQQQKNKNNHLFDLTYHPIPCARKGYQPHPEHKTGLVSNIKGNRGHTIVEARIESIDQNAFG